MPIYIPNQKTDWLFGGNPEEEKERSKEEEFRKKYPYKKK